MKAIIRKDENAVSPVIATILMVAITVVLAAVLYVMVSGLITGPGNAPRAIGGAVTKSADGTNWIVTFTSVPSGLTNTTVTLTVLTGSGATAISATALGSFATASKGITYYSSTKTSTVSAGDRITLAFGTGANQYNTGYQVQLTSSGSILYSGTLQ